jgi:hypothetical protein
MPAWRAASLRKSWQRPSASPWSRTGGWSADESTTRPCATCRMLRLRSGSNWRRCGRTSGGTGRRSTRPAQDHRGPRTSGATTLRTTNARRHRQHEVGSRRGPGPWPSPHAGRTPSSKEHPASRAPRRRSRVGLTAGGPAAFVGSRPIPRIRRGCSRTRYKVGADDRSIRPKARGIGWHRLRANVACLIDWLRILIREGWLGSPRRNHKSCERPHQKKGEQAAIGLLNFRSVWASASLTASAHSRLSTARSRRRPGARAAKPDGQQTLDIEG